MIRKPVAGMFSLIFFFGIPFAQAFVDTESKAIERLVERGITEEKSHFFPDIPCTRGQFTAWVLKNIDEEGSAGTVSAYEDVNASHYFSPYIQRAWELNLLSEKSHFFPQKGITKMDALALLLRAEGIEMAQDYTELPQPDAPKDVEKSMMMKKGIELGLVSEDQNGFLLTNARLTRYQCAKMIDAMSLRRITGESSGFEVLIQPKKIKEDFPKEDVFKQVWNALETKYLRRDNIDAEAVMEQIIKNTVDALGDQHTVFFNEEEVQDFLMNVGAGEQYGIGSQVGLDSEGRVQIVKPLRGSPSEEAGLRPGDVVYKVDGIDVIAAGMSLEEVVSFIKGPEGSSVEIIFLRRDKEIPVTIVRAPIQPESIHPFVYQGYLIIEMDFFGNDTEEDFLNAIAENTVAAEKGIILDLRNNPGGFLQTAIDLLAHILPEESIAVKTRSIDSFHRETVRGPADVANSPFVVLVNSRSASASEIIAGAIQDNKRGVVVGEVTYGKGTAQELLGFDDGSALKVTISEWLTPNDRNIDGVGITPDYETVDNEMNPTEMIDFATRIIQRGHWQIFKE